jgi:hypothetical protein
MGTYIYSIRSPKSVKKVKLDNGDVVTAASYAFAYKPYFSMLGSEPRWQILAKARIKRSANIWDEYVKNGNSWPQAGVVVYDDKHKINKGDPVYSWGRDNLPCCFEDDTMNGAKYLGKVAEVIS